ncbi:molybdopterin-dependent oxidoreductase [Psychrobacter fozii]|uniref:Assimilatory nitrate reductase catalytic subunit n=1 Tax=Psychrobacter fozii TaxID=198480 RepID=A0A2V4US11_9GAMM|nr:molybdopterin-dependent oxidoreductase [Psychrobacter fozii]PYE36552.1 assimilatory nitrate reductase catalytic subunit [Psychrobacter fozii]
MNDATANQSAASKVVSANGLLNGVQKTTDRVIETHDISAAKNIKKAQLSSNSDLIDSSIDALITTIRTTCPYCGVGCGVLASVNATEVLSVKGDPEHPANFGKLCSKGSALAQTLGTARRLTEPYYQNKHVVMQQHQPMQSNNNFTARNLSEKPLIKQTDWDTVLEDVASRLNDTITKHGRDSVMFYVSGQLLTEDYYVANKFIKGFIGNNNIDSNSRLCMSSAVAGHKRAFGADLVPGNYKDLEACDLLVLVGSNMAWCHPILFGRFLAAKKANHNKKLIVIDPRRTDSCEFADLHLPIAAGTDTHLYNGLLHYLDQQGYQNDEYVSQSLGVDDAVNAAKAWSIDEVASACQVSADSIRQFYECVAVTDKTVTAFSMGVNQSQSGTDKVNAIINTHLFTGRVGKVGASPFSLTGQPNAMGGREVGALANLLAAHLELDNADHRQLVADFWQSSQPISPNVGVKACDAAAAILDGRIKAIWIMATNPVVSLPDADNFRQALAECDLVIVSDCSVDSDTVKCADIVLPAQGWGEKSGTVTNSERRISRQRTLMPAAGLAKPDWWILSQVATRMGLTGFDYQHPSEVFNEHVALTAYGNTSNHSTSHSTKTYPRYLNLSKDLYALMTDEVPADKPAQQYISQYVNQNGNQIHTPIALSHQAYEELLPFQWGGTRISMIDKIKPLENEIINSAATITKSQLIAITPSNEASIANVHRRQRRQNPQRIGENRASFEHESDYHTQFESQAIHLRLITGRLRDQWHTMTRTGLAPQLNQHQPIPTLTIHANDAQQLGVQDNDFVQLHRRYENYEKYESYENGVTSDGIVSDTAMSTARNGNEPASTVLAQVAISDTLRVGDAFMPMHWSNAFASFARVGPLIPTVVDPHSGQPELKNSAISVTPVSMQSFGKILVHPEWQDAVIVQLRTILANFSAKASEKELSETKYKARSNNILPEALPALTWSLSHQNNSVLINLASPMVEASSTLACPEFWQQFMASMQSLSQPNSQERVMHTAFTVDNVQNQLRLIVTQSAPEIDSNNAVINSGSSDDERPSTQLIMAVYVAPTQTQLPSVRWLDSCFTDTSQIPANQRYKWLLAGRPASGYVDPGPLVCSCMSVGKNTILNAITQHGCTSATAVGKQCRAGTNCGSCVGQINALIAECAPLAQA